MLYRGRPWGSGGGYMRAFAICKVSMTDNYGTNAEYHCDAAISAGI